VARLASDLEDEAIRKTKSGSRNEMGEGCLDGVGVLEDKGVVFEEHLDRACQRGGRTRIDGVEHPRRLDKDDVGDPSAGGNEGFGNGSLFGVVASEEPNKNVRIKRAHGASFGRGCPA